MRAQARRAHFEEEEESAFVSMTDMTVGFLFIIMILLVFFASQVRTQDVVERRIHDAVVAERDEWQTLAVEALARISALELERDELLYQVAALETQTLSLATQVTQLQTKVRELEEEIRELEEQLARLQAIDPLEAYLARVSQTRRDILLRLRDAMLVDFPDLQVELSEESDALRFQGEGLFASGSQQLTREKREIVAQLATRLDEILPCFTTGTRSSFDDSCNPGFVMIEAVQIEGHTDDVGSDFYNRRLSTDRANTTFLTMTQAADGVMAHRNLRQQPVLSVAAYGPDRPIAENSSPTGRATNRRIDLRFIMVTPQDTDGIAVIRDALGALEDPEQ